MKRRCSPLQQSPPPSESNSQSYVTIEDFQSFINPASYKAIADKEAMGPSLDADLSKYTPSRAVEAHGTDSTAPEIQKQLVELGDRYTKSTIVRELIKSLKNFISTPV